MTGYRTHYGRETVERGARDQVHRGDGVIGDTAYFPSENRI